ncbi:MULTISPECIES: hypothetical protein [unclassified Streptomyces]|uniref:hypothetical protein n=1 Tax=unclassified Streptomyces TaxID=2593676 RepID=UPI0037FFC879
MDEYTVFVHRVVRSLEAAGLDEAAEEIRLTLLLAPGEGRGEQPEGGPSGEGDTTGPWSPRFPASEGSPFNYVVADPDVGAGRGMFTPGVAGSGANERDRDQWETREDDTTSPHLWDLSHSPHRPAEPRTRDEDGS